MSAMDEKEKEAWRQWVAEHPERASAFDLAFDGIGTLLPAPKPPTFPCETCGAELGSNRSCATCMGPTPLDHCVFDFAARALTCRRCGASQPVAMPINVTVLVELTDTFLHRHANCPVQAEQSGGAA